MKVDHSSNKAWLKSGKNHTTQCKFHCIIDGIAFAK